MFLQEQVAEEAWDASEYGNHRAIITVSEASQAVRLVLPWWVPDSHRGGVVVLGPDGDEIGNVLARSSAEYLFEAAGAGVHLAYYLPYQANASSSYPEHDYREPVAPDPGWAATAPRHAVDPAEVRYEAVGEHHRYTDMELPADLPSTVDSPLLAFGEDRDHPVRMPVPPARWAAGDHTGVLRIGGERGEYLAFQIAVYGRELTDVRLDFGALTDGTTALAATEFDCLTLGGTDLTGAAFTRRLDVPDDTVAPLWCGVRIPTELPAGTYRGTITVLAGDPARSTEVAVTLEVAPGVRTDHGDDDPARLSRLRWLDSRLGDDDTVVRPYEPVRVDGDRIGVLGRTVTLADSGLPAALTSFFTAEGAIGDEPAELLAGPARFTVAGPGTELTTTGASVDSSRTAAVDWHAAGADGTLRLELDATAEFDGVLDHRITLTATGDTDLTDVRFELPLRAAAVPYLMGLGVPGGTRPSTLDWSWNVELNQDSVWLGGVEAGVQVRLSDEHYVRPLNTNFYHQRPLVLPTSWHNEGRGGISLRTEGDVVRLVCHSGARTLRAGESLRFDVRLSITPFKPRRTDRHFAQRYFHAYEPIEQIAATGATVVNTHHATAINPYINYPFLAADAMKPYVDDAHAAGLAAKVYYTVREITTRAPELWALRSLGTEVLTGGPGGGCSWLREHVGTGYLPAWFATPTEDSSLVVGGANRWHNFYVEGLAWLVENIGIDGIYLDDIAFDREIMKRLRRVLDRGRPDPLIDVHSANQYNPRDGYASSANLYLEHLPYTDRLWFGEYFDYDSAPDRWLVEMSGIPFGLLGEMLQDGGNPWRGMVYGMTARLAHGGDPRPLWREWDAFGITEATMLGYWSPRNPVATGRDDVLATTYLRDGRALVAVASWADEPVEVRLDIDWAAIGGDSRSVRAEPIEGFQSAAEFTDGPVPLEPGRGWLLRLGD